MLREWEETTFKGIPMVDHTVSLDPAQTQIQGKILGASNWVDALPGALHTPLRFITFLIIPYHILSYLSILSLASPVVVLTLSSEVK